MLGLALLGLELPVALLGLLGLLGLGLGLGLLMLLRLGLWLLMLLMLLVAQERRLQQTLATQQHEGLESCK